MAKKTKPLLHLVRGGKDHDLYNADLDWFFGCYDSLAGHKSAMGGQLAVLNGIVSCPGSSESNFYDDRQVSFCGREGVFERGRRIWARLRLVDGPHQRTLRAFYEPRQYFPKEYQAPSEAEIKSAHVAFRETGRS
jgi:hypothetical protein